MLKADTTAGTARISCDSCPASMDSVMDANPRAAREKAGRVAKIARWLIEKHAGSLQHFCPSYRKSREKGSLL
ncbi:hypothetical protein E0H64_17910 [Rhizobium leguminosarum bv. viciae]|uniref:hypothetical protein n=1 Tax=Rhizobium TaxID=379 RepID=UPI00103C1A55|nr:hypothetical protein [Rhizobium leguminosarum]TBZ67870.1 hypothetical protein E0H64_17910 [Rhizobium leguminosarum bv. viciae]